ncbi:MAG: NUDIX domain-containing protein [Sphingobacteriia bacterium]|nr:NUDIX domain-containing protein [Sphingobacteriia bacterium]
MKIYRIIKNIILSVLARRTIGARVLVIKDEKVLLVEHTYMPGWYTIGGAVEKGESPKEAIIRELSEEVGISVHSLDLFNVYYSYNEKRDDYIVFYICKDFIETEHFSKAEIKEKRWFALDNLPESVSPATLRRIKEYQGINKITDKW